MASLCPQVETRNFFPYFSSFFLLFPSLIYFFFYSSFEWKKLWFDLDGDIILTRPFLLPNSFASDFSIPFVLCLCRNNARWVEWQWNWRVEYWAIRSSICSFTRTGHSFACSALLAEVARFAAFIRSLARSLANFGAHGKGFCQWIERVDLLQFQPTVLRSMGWYRVILKKGSIWYF